MTAFVSDDDGATWKGGLLLNERESSYPDGIQAEDGTLFITYDHQRYTLNRAGKRGVGSFVMATFREADIRPARAVTDQLRRRVVTAQLQPVANAAELKHAILSVPKVRYCGKIRGRRKTMEIADKSDLHDLNLIGQRLRQRLEPGRGERPGRPSDPSWALQRKLSMNEQTLEMLVKAAESISNEQRRVSPMQIAALLIEDATQGLAKHLNQN